ncbi:MAG: ABC transporter ATP-binding protein [Paraglaciecola sp.]|uniref:ABC transporter ATP-binding protein n=1 Tax=Paraglaciecola sp. TaxID=1920173 RepID=UPI003299663A
MTKHCIETFQLTKTFGNKTAVNQLDLAIKTGGIHAFVGSNGAGKSTLFRLLLGVATPTSGSAVLLGQDCTNLSTEVRGKVGYVNEEHTLPTWMSVEKVVAMQKHFYQNWEQNIYDRVIGYFDVDPKQKVAGLSRGERAGFNLSMALAQSPEILILDEPTLGLDVVAKQSFLEALMFTEIENDSTIIYCSHQMEEVERVADNLVILEKGRLMNNSAPDEFVERIRSWVVDFDGKPLDKNAVDGLLSAKLIDGQHHIVTLDQTDASFRQALNKLGAKDVQPMGVTLNSAVNAFLAKNHNVPA